MKQFILIYVGIDLELTKLPVQESTAILNSWNQWSQGLGGALIDPGKPFLAGIDLIDNGERVAPLPMKGHAIVQAEDIDQALNLAQNHPILTGKEGRCSISVFELMTEPIETYAQAQPASPAVEQPPQPPTPPPPGTLPPPVEEEAVPTQNPGELTIPHEIPEENQPPTPPSPPTPGQPSV